MSRKMYRPGLVCIHFYLVIFFIAWVNTSCSSGQGQGSTLPVLVTDNVDAEQLYNQAKEEERLGRLKQAELQYEEFLKRYPKDSLVPLVKIGLGKILLDKGVYERADSFFLEAMNSSHAAVSELASLYHGVMLHLTGKHKEALRVLQPLVGKTVDADATTLLLQAVAASSELLGDSSLAVEALDRLASSPIPKQERVQVTNQILNILEKRTTVESRKELYEVLSRDGVAWTMLAKLVLRDSLENGQWVQAKAIVEDLRQTEAEFDAELLGWMARVERTSQADPRVIGAILPMTGRGRIVGQSTLQGLMMAAGVPSEGPVSLNSFQLVFRDDAGSPVKAVQAVDELVSAHRAIAILGPLSTEATIVASARAHELGVPLLSLAPKRPPVEVERELFFVFPSPDEEVSALLKVAARQGHRKFVLLFPSTAYGLAMKNAFLRQVQNQNVEHAVSLEFDASDIKTVAEKLQKYSFDALFFPGTSEELEMLSSVLSASGFWRREGTAKGPSISYLSTSLAFSTNISRSSMRYLEGSVVSCPYAPSVNPESQAFLFSQKYKEQFGDSANQFSAHAFDGFRLLVKVIREGARDRKSVVEALNNKVLFEPLSGISKGLLQNPIHDFVCVVREGRWESARTNKQSQQAAPTQSPQK